VDEPEGDTAASAVDPVAGFAWLLFAVFDEELLGELLERLDLLTEGEGHACPLVVTRQERCDAHSVDL
jgi:hypothetical protein